MVNLDLAVLDVVVVVMVVMHLLCDSHLLILILIAHTFSLTRQRLDHPHLT